MFTVKRIINGATTVSEHETVTIAPRGSEPFIDAVNYTKCPSTTDDLQEAGIGTTPTPVGTLLEDGNYRVERDGVVTYSDHYGAPLGLDYTPAPEKIQVACVYRVTGVTVIRDDNNEQILLSSAPGTWGVTDALGVLITDTSSDGHRGQEVQYDFIYPGEEVYVVNSHGSTVAQLRR